MSDMSNASENRSTETSRFQTEALILAFVSLAYAIFTLGYLAFRARIGPELSDTSYYLLNQRHPETLSLQLQQFGTLWKAFVGVDQVYPGRLINISLSFAISVGCSFSILRRLYPGRTVVSVMPFALIGGTSCLNIFAAGIFDFSYNSAAFLSVLVVVTALVMLGSDPNRDATKNIRSDGFWAFVGGLAFTVLGLVKPQSAVFLFVVCLALFAAFEAKMWTKEKFVKTLTFSLLGFLFVILIVWLRVKSPMLVAEHLWLGFTSLSVLGAHEMSFASETEKFSKMLGNGLANTVKIGRVGLVEFFSVVGLLLFPWFALHKFWRTKSQARVAAYVLAVAAFLFSCTVPVNADLKSMRGLFDALFMWCLFLLVFAARERVGRPTRWRSGLLCVLALGFAVVLLGTTGVWSKYNHMHFGLTVIALITAVAGLPPVRRQAYFVPLSVILLWNGALSFNHLENHPYRMGPLAGPMATVEFGGDLGRLLYPVAEVGQIIALGRIREQLKPQDGTHIIDMSGHAPGAALFLGLDPGPAAWLLGGYSGSDDYLSMALAGFPNEHLAEALVAFPFAGDKALSIGVLNDALSRVGKKFPDDYALVGSFPLNYMRYQIGVFRLKR